MNLLLRSTCVLTLALATVPAKAAGNAVTFWNQVACDSVVAAGFDPMNNSRILAMTHAAVHDAVNAIDKRYRPYVFHGTSERPDAVADAAVAAAAYNVLIRLVPHQRFVLEKVYYGVMAGIPNNAARGAGITVGQQAAQRILTEREYDRASQTITVQPGTMPGDYRPTPPDFTPAFAAHWGRVTPFALRNAQQFRPKAPPRLGSDQYEADYKEVFEIGRDTSTRRTAEQSLIARHWYENSTEGWNRIARVVAEQRSLGVWEAARLMALVNIAMADGFIAGFEAKYHFDFWRPVTAIREGYADGNPQTNGDPQWLPYLWTPPVPDYPSTHSVLGAAAAAVLARFFEGDMVAFEFTSGVPYAGTRRAYWSFSEAAHENAMSRVLAGIHFRSAVLAGLEQGYEVGEFVYDRVLQKIR